MQAQTLPLPLPSLESDRVIVARNATGPLSLTVAYTDGSAVVYDIAGADQASIVRAVCAVLADGAIDMGPARVVADADNHVRGLRAAWRDGVRLLWVGTDWVYPDLPGDVRAFLAGDETY